MSSSSSHTLGLKTSKVMNEPYVPALVAAVPRTPNRMDACALVTPGVVLAATLAPAVAGLSTMGFHGSVSKLVQVALASTVQPPTTPAPDTARRQAPKRLSLVSAQRLVAGWKSSNVAFS